MRNEGRSRYVIIALMILLMASGVFIVGSWIGSGGDSIELVGETLEPAVRSRLVHERSGFLRGDVAHSYLRAVAGGTRTLDEFYDLRAYLGAPPAVPHPIEKRMTIGADVCLTCHKDGGYVPRWDAYTPVTPHPEMRNCRQCHNPRGDGSLFVPSDFRSNDRPELNGNPLPGGPPPMPHSLNLRENCLACHAGPGAVKELRTTHPDRVNCRQCHAQRTDNKVWDRPGGLNGTVEQRREE